MYDDLAAKHPESQSKSLHLLVVKRYPDATSPEQDYVSRTPTFNVFQRNYDLLFANKLDYFERFQ